MRIPLPLRLSSLALAFCAVLPLAAAPARADEGSPTRPRLQPRAWEHESSDVPANERIRFGRLENGVRYAVMENAEPKDRCYLRVHVDAGSLNETDAERGMAHFLEHMAFNGSENFAPGTLVERLQKRGLDFGAHTNAFTSFDQTVYMLDLPESSAELVKEGLTIFRDFVDGLLIDPKEVDAEKGVIDGEERERDSAAARLGEKVLERLFAGSRIAERLPIGTKEARDAFDADLVRGFWRRWYRPENVTVVVVGDLKGLDPVPMIEETFGSIEAPEGPVQLEPARGKPTLSDVTFALHDAEIPTVSMEVSRIRSYEHEPYTRAELVEDLPVQVARSMLNLRFAELARKPDAPFLRAGVGDQSAFELIEGESLSVVARPERWQEALSAAERELRRAVLHGFRVGELEEVRADMLRNLDEAVEREATRSSGSYVQEILAAAESPFVPADAKTEREILAPAIRALTVEACAKAFADVWSKGVESIVVTGGLDLGGDGGDELRRVLEESRKVEVEAPPELKDAAFAYASDASKAGEIVADEMREDVGVRTVRFANGATLHVKSTDFKERQVIVVALVGDGSLDANDAALRTVAGQAFGNTGVDAHDQDELRRLLAGKEAGVSFGIGEDAFAFEGSTNADDLQLQFDLLAAYLSHPSWRDTGLEQYRRVAPATYQRLDSLPIGPFLRKFRPALFKNDWRFQFPELDSVMAVDVPRVREWLEPRLRDGRLTVVVVGDVETDAVVAAAKRTVGLLPPRSAAVASADLRKVPPMTGGVRMDETIVTETPNADITVMFPATDGLDPKLRRELQFLGRILNDRVRLEIREKLGVSYSPNAGSQISSTYPGLGWFQISASGDPQQADRVAEACLAVAGKLAAEGTTDEEIERLRTPVLAQIKDQRRNNGFWTRMLADLHNVPSSIDQALAWEEHVMGIDAARMNELAKQYLDPANASVLIVRPAKAAAAGSGATKDGAGS